MDIDNEGIDLRVAVSMVEALVDPESAVMGFGSRGSWVLTLANQHEGQGAKLVMCRGRNGWSEENTCGLMGARLLQLGGGVGAAGTVLRPLCIRL